MSYTWSKISPDQARQHKLYGVGGWLLVFAIGSALGFLKSFGMIGGEAAKAGMTIGQLLDVDHPAMAFAKTSLSLEGIALAILYWALFTKKSSFRVIATTIAAGLFPLVAIIGFSKPFAGLADVMVIGTFQWVLSCAIWLSYLHKSRRVRVTFEHCVRSDEIPATSQTTAPTQEVRIALKSAPSINLTHTPIPTPSNFLPQDSVYQPTARPQQPVMPVIKTPSAHLLTGVFILLIFLGAIAYTITKNNAGNANPVKERGPRSQDISTLPANDEIKKPGEQAKSLPPAADSDANALSRSELIAMLSQRWLCTDNTVWEFTAHNNNLQGRSYPVGIPDRAIVLKVDVFAGGFRNMWFTVNYKANGSSYSYHYPIVSISTNSLAYREEGSLRMCNRIS